MAKQKRILGLMLSTIFFLCYLLPTVPITKTYGTSAKKNTESYANLVIFIQFSDTEGNFMETDNYLENALKYYTDDSYEKSLYGYINTISYGQMHIKSYLPQYDETINNITPITLSHTREWYINNGVDYTSQKESIDILNAKYDLSKYDFDLNDDGCVDNITFMYQGDGGSRLSFFYPKKMDYGGSEKINSLSIGTVNVLNAKAALDSTSLEREGVICHEYMHSLGYPDLYTEGSEVPVGRWDLMASASTFMQYPLAYMRMYVSGWLNIDTITQESDVTLNPASSPDGNEAYIIKSPLSDSEFFVIEYRKQGEKFTNDLDIKIPGSGLIVYRINTKAMRLSNHYGLPYGVYIFRPGETTVNGSTSENLNNSFYSEDIGRTEIGSIDLTKGISDNALVFADGSNSGIRISNIGKAEDTISCHISFANYSNVDMWSKAGEGQVSSEPASAISIDTDNDGNVYTLFDTNYNLKVSKFNGTTWQQLSGNIPDYSANAVIRVLNGVPYVMFSKANNEFSMELYKYQNDSWVNIKEWNAESGSYIQYMDLEKNNNNLFILYGEGTGLKYTLKLLKYDGNSFTEISGNIVSTYISSPDMAVDGEKVYIAYRNFSSNIPEVYCYDGITCSKMAEVSAACDSTTRISAKNGNVFLIADDTKNGMTVYKYPVSGVWQQVGNSSLTSIQSSTCDIDIINDTPVVQLVHQESEKSNTQVYRYIDNEWKMEGTTIDSTISNDAELAVFNDTIYLGFLSEMGYDSFPIIKMKKIQTPPKPLKGVLKVNGSTSQLNLKVGESVNLEVSGSGGSGKYTYQYVMKNVNTGAMIILKNYSSATTYTGPLVSAGTKRFIVNIKDGTGKVTSANIVTVVVTKPLKGSLKVNGSMEKQYLHVGDSVNLVANATGGSGKYTYQYVMKNVNTGAIIILKNFSTSTTYKGPLVSKGVKCFIVNIKDSSGRITSANIVTVVVS